jgi:hypothetical protein
VGGSSGKAPRIQFLTLKVSSQLHAPAVITSEKEFREVGWVGPRAWLDTVGAAEPTCCLESKSVTAVTDMCRHMYFCKNSFCCLLPSHML